MIDLSTARMRQEFFDKLLRQLERNGIKVSRGWCYAVHEAHHALCTKLAPPWNEERLTRAVARQRPGDRALDEIVARRIEQEMAKRFHLDIKPIESFLLTSCLEATSFRDPFFSFEQAVKIAKGIPVARVTQATNAIFALAAASGSSCEDQESTTPKPPSSAKKRTPSPSWCSSSKATRAAASRCRPKRSTKRTARS